MAERGFGRLRMGAVWGLVALALGLGCNDDRRPSAVVDSPVLHDLRIVSGNNQAGPAGMPLEQPLVVVAVDRQAQPLGGIRVRFAIAAGGGALSDTVGVTGSDGRAQTRLTLGAAPGVNRVTATVEGLSGLPPTFTATAEGEAADGVLPLGPGGAPDRAHFSLALEQLNMPGGVEFGLTNRVTAFVFDADSNPVPAGTLVRFKTSGGGIEGSARTDASGRATVTLTTAEPVPADGRALITAEVEGEGDTLLTAQAQVLFSGPTAVRLLQPASFSVAPGEQQPFIIFVGDDKDNPLAAGTRVLVTAEDGTVTGQTDVTLPDTQAPEATRFSVLFQAGGAGSRPRMIVQVTSPNGNRTVRFPDAGAPAGPRRTAVGMGLEVADSVLVADGVSTTTVTATVRDSAGVGVPDQIVNFAASVGQIDAAGLTNTIGQAAATYRGILDTAGVADVRIAATSGVLSAETGLRMPGVRLRLSASQDTIVADGNAQATVRAVLQDSDGRPIPNAMVQFETTLGTLSTLSAETDAAGVAQTILISGTDAGKAVVTATFGSGLSGRVSVAFVKGPPASIVLISVEPPAIGVRGAGSNETAIVTFEVRDDRGNPVADGEPILFRLDAPDAGDEQVGPDSTATVEGRVQAAVSSGTVARTVRVIAEAVLASGVTVRSVPVPISIHGGPPDEAHFSISVEPVNLAGRVLLGLQSTITAFVFDKFSNPVPQGTSIQFQTDGGGIQGSAETDADGQASVLLFTARPAPPGPDFLATVTAQTVDENGQEIRTTNTVLFSGPTAPIQITGEGADSIRNGSLFVPNGGFQIITFTVSDTSGLPIMGGSTVEVASDVALISGDANITVPDVRSGSTSFAITVADPAPNEDPIQPPQRGSVLIRVTSLNGNRLLTFGLTVD